MHGDNFEGFSTVSLMVRAGSSPGAHSSDPTFSYLQAWGTEPRERRQPVSPAELWAVTVAQV